MHSSSLCRTLLFFPPLREESQVKVASRSPSQIHLPPPATPPPSWGSICSELVWKNQGIGGSCMFESSRSHCGGHASCAATSRHQMGSSLPGATLCSCLGESALPEELSAPGAVMEAAGASSRLDGMRTSPQANYGPFKCRICGHPCLWHIPQLTRVRAACQAASCLAFER